MTQRPKASGDGRSSTVTRLSAAEMEEYWRRHADQRASVVASDHEALGNVCHPGQPLWLNQHYAAGQRQTFLYLLGQVPPPVRGGSAIDVGCGAGRWCRVLAARGYDTTGIDLQPTLIERNQRRHPEMHFLNVSLEDFQPDRRFDVVSTVTVLGHIPFDRQPAAVSKLRAIITDGGHAIILENVSDQAPHVFSNDMDTWIDLFEAGGFTLKHVLPYDYNPALRVSGAVRSRVGGSRLSALPVSQAVQAEKRWYQRAAAAVTRAAVMVDRRLEPWLIERRPALAYVHCGFLFAAV